MTGIQALVAAARAPDAYLCRRCIPTLAAVRERKRRLRQVQMLKGCVVRRVGVGSLIELTDCVHVCDL